MLSIIAGGLLLSAHSVALPVLCASHMVCITLCLALRRAALVHEQDSFAARVASEVFLCGHACVLLLLLLQGRSIVLGVRSNCALVAAAA
jgi:hypothetical protein